MKRTQLVLGALLLVQLVLILVFRSPFAGAAPAVSAQPLLPALDTLVPARVEIEGKEGVKLDLRKQGEGWALADPAGFPADGKKVDELIGKLKGLRVRRPVVTSAKYHEQFKVAEAQPEARLRMFAAGEDAAKVDLLVGESANFRTTHVRRAGEDAVYEVQGLAAYDLPAKPGDWVNKELVEIPAEQVTALSVTNAKGTFELVKDSGGWKVVSPAKLSGRRLDAAKVDTLVRSAASIRLTDPAGKVDAAAQGFEPAAATVRVRWQPPAPPPPA
ncbi:MAG TPA: DUF4340 domain-containing protein, partial [Candidatus Polarisedimenticolaceae bacterium]|nr:DUF4340 domain-containing protein [Candidatus Polarisedimenticolaceae bacterium]